MSARSELKKFDLKNLPTLDVAVLGALELLAEVESPKATVPFRRPLVIGSGNAEGTGRIIFKESDAVFADESNYELALARVPDIDGVVLISASGGKHATGIAKHLSEKGTEVVLFTNNESAPARAFIPDEMVRVFPKNREPYTYNTSTYLAMIVSDSGEDPRAIAAFLNESVAPACDPKWKKYDAFTMIIPAACAELKPMLRTKFDELFGSRVCGRIFAPEEMKHAKTVIPNENEAFIACGVDNASYGAIENRFFVPLQEGGGYAAALAATYFIVGRIQAMKPPYFKDNIEEYCRQASLLFGQPIDPIVE